MHLPCLDLLEATPAILRGLMSDIARRGRPLETGGGSILDRGGALPPFAFGGSLLPGALEPHSQRGDAGIRARRRADAPRRLQERESGGGPRAVRAPAGTQHRTTAWPTGGGRQAYARRLAVGEITAAKCCRADGRCMTWTSPDRLAESIRPLLGLSDRDVVMAEHQLTTRCGRPDSCDARWRKCAATLFGVGRLRPRQGMVAVAPSAGWSQTSHPRIRPA